MRRKLILVRHSLPNIVPDVPACQWTLSEPGRQRCKPLASRLAPWQPGIVAASLEPKAIETGRLVAELMDIPFETAAGLHEHEREGVEFTTRERLQADVATFFRQPGKQVFGNETADQARRRFHQAVTIVLAEHPLDSVAIVAHGTVMTLFVNQVAGVEPFRFWQRLGLPAFVVFGLPEMSLGQTRIAPRGLPNPRSRSGSGDPERAELERSRLLAVEEHVC